MIRPVEPAFLLVVGRIATLAGASGFGWVEAVAIGHDGTVVAAGAAADLEPLVSRATRRLRLGPEQVAIPALADAHLHLLDAALADERLDLVGLARPAALDRIARAHQALADPDAWLEGDGWHPDAWGGWPDAEDLERVAPGRRAAFWAHARHALWASERALAEAGVDAARGDPPGGAIRRRPDGRPTGVLHETAAPLVLRRIPVPSIERRVEAVARLVPRLVGAGIGAV
ncbi:MAG TPA: amidohydrolase family protein, partial [Candidatus Dormibacteraeota bacterium]|nr:amidohydrolase family protein [Candidatus Dormibacteraeota bacterium]